ncbi:envoplakin a [Esox lucius]|uniref:Desmoplakin SH3 domain-containing protein n=1 Tax=Esox lucius TaxID=8010 RepID=A0AAY5KMQ2_ESOLU|nr:envoplakin a [Esox lucius]
MFKKKESSKESKDNSVKVSGKVSQSTANNLASVIERMQKNADQVEKNVLQAEELLALDSENEKKGLALQHHKVVSDKLSQAEGLLKDLYLDVDKAKKLKHPQGSEIESDVSHLHDRWLKDCTFYREIYEPLNDVELKPRINWATLLNQKQRELNTEEYGPTMDDLKKQIATHNILHKEIESYNSQLSASSASTKEEYATIKKQYNNLLDNSKWRGHYLSSLHEYMQSCKKELAFLEDEEHKVLKQDWSDNIVDPQDIRREYEKFKDNSLLAHESEVNRLQDDGDRLIELKHPASTTIQAQRDDVRREWQKFLNLCICKETHLDNIEDFKKYQLDVDTLSKSLDELNSSLKKVESGSVKSGSAMTLQLEAEESTVQRSEKLLADLRKRSTSIAPLKLRRQTPSKSTTVESLCDWETGNAEISRGDKFSLKSNSNVENWEVLTSSGAPSTFPGVCFQIPPPDPESISIIDLHGDVLDDIKKRRAVYLATTKDSIRRVQERPVNAAPPPNLKPKAADIQLDKLDGELVTAKQGLLSHMRAPLDRSDPTADLTNRLKEQEKAADALAALDPPKLDKDDSKDLATKLQAAKDKKEDLKALVNLCNEKSNASLNLEKQIKNVDGIVSGFEKKLSEDAPIPDEPNAIQTRTQYIQSLRKEALVSLDEVKKLAKNLETSEQLCSSLQQGYQEYCPDIGRQRTQVKQLQNRYANVNNQLKDRENLLLQAGSKHQEFQSTSKSLNSFLGSLPNNKISPSDDLSKINTKQISQQRVVEDLKRKGDDLDRVVDLSQDLQIVLNDYEVHTNKYNSTLNLGAKDAKNSSTPVLADAVQKQEKALVNCYAETSAENNQLLKQMDFAKNVITEQKQQKQSIQPTLQPSIDIASLQQELNVETDRRNRAENELEIFRTRMQSLKSRRGMHRVEEKEVLKYYRDPKLESNLKDLEDQIHKEAMNRSRTQGEIETVKIKIVTIGDELKNVKPKLVTKEVTEFERDPQLDIESTKLRDEIGKIKKEVRVKEGEVIQQKTEVTILNATRPNIREKVVKKEVIRVEKDPEMLKAVQTFQTEIVSEGNKSKALNDEIFQTRSQINALERIIPTIQPKVITKEVKRTEQDPDLVNESKRIRSDLEEAKVETDNLGKEVSKLRSRYTEVGLWKPKIEVKEIVNEIYRIDPQTEVEIMRLKKDVQDANRQRSDLETQITVVMADLVALRAKKPKVEMKEVIQEVVKEERSPENEREIQRLNDQVNQLHHTYNEIEDNLNLLRREREKWKAEKSKVETQLVPKNVVKYEDDPLLEKEADRLRKELREEQQCRRTTEEMVFDLQNKYILLDRQRPEEKVVVQEVVRLQKDPKQIVEHEKLGRSLDVEVNARRQMELEMQKLRSLVEEKENILRQSDEHQKKIQVEFELKQIKLRIKELENAPPPVEESIIIEEVMKVERDPKLETMTNGLRSDMDKETNEILNLQRNIRNITVRIELLQREKAGERTVYKEVIRVEKDQVVEAERDRLRSQVNDEKHARQDLEQKIQQLSDKLNQLKNSQINTSREETSLILARDALQREKDNLTRELKKLDSDRKDISLSFQQQTKLLSERSQMNRQKSIKMETDVQRLEREILDEKDVIHQKDGKIRELQREKEKEDRAETQTKETNVSTRITILDPDTGKELSPYEAYMQGLIDRSQYMHLEELECDWEEITSLGPDGETSVLQDRKSGKQYSIKNALRDGRLNQQDLQKYKDGKMHISEFALLVAGEKEKPLKFNSITPTASSLVRSSPTSQPPATVPREMYPISGVIDTDTNVCFSIRDAASRKLIDNGTAQKLLEAQAATGGIVDISNKERYSVHKAAEKGLIESGQLQRLLNAQKAYTGVEDPMTKERLSVGESVLKGWMPKETALRYMEAQYLTGGLVNPNNTGRVGLQEAMSAKMIDSTMMRELQSEYIYTKDIVDPNTKEKINYKQAMALCKTDPTSGLLMLPASSTASSSTYTRYNPHSYSSRY